MNNFSFLPQTRSSADATLAWYGQRGGGEAGRRAGTKRIFTHFLCSSTQSTSHQMAILGSWSTHTNTHTQRHAHAQRRLSCTCVNHTTRCLRRLSAGFADERKKSEGGGERGNWQLYPGNLQLAIGSWHFLFRFWICFSFFFSFGFFGLVTRSKNSHYEQLTKAFLRQCDASWQLTVNCLHFQRIFSAFVSALIAYHSPRMRMCVCVFVCSNFTFWHKARHKLLYRSSIFA